MVKLKEPAIGEMCRTIQVDGFGDYANPERVRMSLYMIRMGLPEREEGEQVLQLARESEIVFSRALFLKFAERVESLKNWLEQHPIEEMDLDKDELKKYVHEHFTSDEIIGLWLGHELKYPDSVPLGLIPLMNEEEEEN